MAECDGCFNDTSECLGYGSCVPRLRAELATAKAELACFMLTVHKAREENDAAHARAEAAEAALAERERRIAELAEERDEYFRVVGHSRTSEFREKLAALCHEQWSGWMKHLFGKCLPGWDNPKELVIPAWAVERWTRQLTTSYGGLSEAEKDSDREEADRILSLFSPKLAKGGQ